MINQRELVEEISKNTSIPYIECERVIEAFKSIITDKLEQGEQIMLRGFCTFMTTTRKKRNGYNPFTKTFNEFPELKSAKCIMGKTVKDRVGGK